MVLKRNSKRTGEIIQLLLRWSEKRKGIFKEPKFWLPKTRTEKAFFITTSMVFNYGNSTKAKILWAAAKKTWDDPSTHWVFFPREVIQRTTTDELEEALEKHGLGGRYLEQNTKNWRTVSNSFVKEFDGNPINLLKEYDYDPKISSALKYLWDFNNKTNKTKISSKLEVELPNHYKIGE